MKKLLAACAVAVFCACAPVAPPAPATSQAEHQIFPRDQQPTADAQAACTAAHGDYRQMGLMGSWMCVTPATDAGKVCSDKKDCAGQCIYDGEGTPSPDATVQGRCQSTNVQFGCFSMIQGGHAQPPLCVD